MATTFINPPSTDKPILTSDFYSISARVSSISARVSVEESGDVFFETNLYSFDGVVTVYDIGQLLENRMREKEQSYATYSIKIEDATLTITALYCEYSLPGFDAGRLGQFYLSPTSTRVVTRNSRIFLNQWSTASTRFSFRFVGKNASGEIDVFEPAMTSGGITRFFDRPVPDILKEMTGDLVEVTQFTISNGPAQKLFFLTKEIPCASFQYRNLFNSIDYIDVFGTVTTKTEVSRNEAICNNRVTQYDRAIARTYEVQTGPLTADQVRDLEQLISSHSVILQDTDLDIIITDHTVEIPDSDDALPTIKFTFRFADYHVVMTPDMIQSVSHVSPGIFTEVFTDQYQ